jgi:hypothetical protein
MSATSSVLAPLIEVVNVLVDRLVTNKNKAQEIKSKITELQANGELDRLAGQLAINKLEAQSPSVFVAGWRPFIGWVCGAALAYQYLIRPIIIYVSALKGLDPTHIPPGLDNNLWELMFGMLGLGTLRTFEKVKGTA